MKTIIALLLLCCPAFAQSGANLVPPASATDTAILSGSWQDAATWTDGTIPCPGEKVYIPPGMTVTNHAVTADVLWIHVAGTLTTCDHCDTQLNVHTLYVPMGGTLDLGHVGMPRTGKTVVEFTGGASLAGDWQKLSGGLIVHGEFSACGVEKTAWDMVDGDLAVGATTLRLANVPVNWQVGDTITVTGTDSRVGSDVTATYRYQTETRTITGIVGNQVAWAGPLTYRHWRWKPDLPFHCANLSRNVMVRSRQTDVPNRGHLMFMSSATDLRYLEIKDCGRTDKSQPVTDPRLDTYGAFVAGSDANPRARYACHWHRVGEMGSPASVRGCVVNGSPGWGFLNHRSNVQVDDCIALRCFGFGFGTEEGQERGHFRHCLSVLNRGQGDTISSGDDDFGILELGDWGKDGSGFWLQGGMVDVEDCVACDNSGRGFAFFNQALNGYPDYNVVKDWIRFPIVVSPQLFPPEYLSMSGWNGQPYPSMYVPQRVFTRNTAYLNKFGLQSWLCMANFNHTDEFLPPSIRGRVTDFTTWGRGALAHFEYSRNFTIDGLRIVGDGGFRTQWIPSSTPQPPLIVRFPNITVTRLNVQDKLDRDNWPNPKPIVFVGTDGTLPTIQVEGSYPIVNGNTGARIR